MSLVRIRMKDTGVLAAVDALIADLSATGGLGRAMRFAASAIWIPNIEERLFNTDTSTSDYKAHLYSTMKDLSPRFVQYLGNASGWADVMEWERVNKRGGYREDEISGAIAKALRASQAMNMGGIIAVGIGNIEQLIGATSNLDGSNEYKMWEILQYGTGTYAGKGQIVRAGKKMIFYDKTKTSFVDQGAHVNDTEHGILARQTKSKGFRGREYFVQLDGTMHESDIVTQTYILNYINKTIRKYSYKKGGVRG